MSNLRIWRDVPDGATVEFAVIDATPNGTRPFVARAELFEELTGNNRTWNDAELQRVNPPSQAQLAAPNVYAVRFRVSFTGAGVARVRALLRSNGVIIRTLYQYTINGQNGDVVPAMLAISTV